MPPRGRQGRGSGRGGGALAGSSGAASAAGSHLREGQGAAALRAAVPTLSAVAAHQLELAETAPVPSIARLDHVLRVLGDHINVAPGQIQQLRMALLHKPLLAALLQLAAAAAQMPLEDLWRLDSQMARDGARPSYIMRSIPDVVLPVLEGAAKRAITHTAALWSITCDIALQLLRMQVLHRAARQAAGAVVALRRGVALPAGMEAVWLWDSLSRLFVITTFPATFDSEALADCGPDALARCCQLRLEAAESLISSGVLEHAAQGMVLLAGHPGLTAAAAGRLRECMSLIHYTTGRLTQVNRDDASEGPARDSVRALMRALHTPRLRHLHTAIGLAALHATDGGATHGLDVRLYGRLAPDDATLPVCNACSSLLALVDALGHATGAQHPRPRTAAALLLRVLRAAVACMHATAHTFGSGPGATATPASAAATAGVVQPLHRYMDAESVVRYGLAVASDLLQRGFGGGRAVPEPMLTERWRLALSYLDALVAAGDTANLRAMARAELQRCCSLLGPYEDQHYNPYVHQSRMQAAVDAGLLPWLERALRAAGRSPPGGPHCQLADEVPSNAPLMWLLLLDEPKRAAALVVTLRKLMRSDRTTRPGMAVSRAALRAQAALACVQSLVPEFPRPGGPPAAQAHPMAGAAAAPPAAAARAAPPGAAPRGAPHAAAGAGRRLPGDGEDVAGPSPLLSLMVHELLPALASWLIRNEGPLVQVLYGGDAVASHVACLVWQCVLGLVVQACIALSAVPMAAGRARGRGGAAAARGGAAGAGSSGSAPGASCSSVAAGGGSSSTGAAGRGCAGGGPPGASTAGARDAGECKAPAGLGGSSRGIRPVRAASAGGAAQGGSSAGASASSTAGGSGSNGISAANATGLEELLDRLDLVGLVRAGLRYLKHAMLVSTADEILTPGTVDVGTWICTAFVVATARPEVVRKAAQEWGAAHGSSGGGSGGASDIIGWPLMDLLPSLRGDPRHSDVALVVQQLEFWSCGSMDIVLPQLGLSHRVGPMAYLVPYGEARSLLRTCSNPGCAELKGDSEAGLEAGLLRCSGCGAAWYCCKGCQVAHWHAGHKGACGGKAGAR